MSVITIKGVWPQNQALCLELLRYQYQHQFYLKVIQIPIKFFIWCLSTLNCQLSQMHCAWLHYTTDCMVIAAAACRNDVKTACDDWKRRQYTNRNFLDLHTLLNAGVVSLKKLLYYLVLGCLGRHLKRYRVWITSPSLGSLIEKQRNPSYWS